MPSVVGQMTKGAVFDSIVDAEDSAIADALAIITATSVEGALQENRVAIDLNTLKSTNVPTALSTGTVNGTSYGITSDSGADDVILAQADTDNAGVLSAVKWDEIVANSLKATNVSTDLSEGTSTETTVDVNSSDGNNATLASASTSRAGLLTKAKWDEIVANSLKNTNVPTELSVGTRAATTLAITSDGGADDVTLPAADTDYAGLMTDAQYDKLAGIEASADVNNISDGNATDLTDGGDTTLHDHDGISENTSHRTSDGSDHTFVDQAVTIAASPTFADVAVPVNGKIYFEGAAGDTYITYNSATNRLEVYRDGQKRFAF